MSHQFPSLKGKQMLAILKAQGAEVVRQNGSHRIIRYRNQPQFVFSAHDGHSVRPSMVRKVLTKDMGLSEKDALDLF